LRKLRRKGKKYTKQVSMIILRNNTNFVSAYVFKHHETAGADHERSGQPPTRRADENMRKLSNRQITGDKVWLRRSLARLASRKGQAREYYGRTWTCGLSRGRLCLGCSPASRRTRIWVFFLILFDRLISPLLQSPFQKRNSSYENTVPRMFLKFKKSRWSSYMWFRRSFPAVFPAVAETLDPLHNMEWGQFKMKKKDQ
jgi:hypothetical protein